MSQQTNSTSSPLLITSSVQDCQVFDCRWGWCRFSTLTNAGLAEHVVQEHIKNATPVRRRDIPMLRRAEEGIGESLSLSLNKMLGGRYDMVGSRTLNSSNATSQDILSSPRPSSSQHPHTSSLPSPPVLSTTHSPPQNNANAERLRSTPTPPSFYESELRPTIPSPVRSLARPSRSPSPSPSVTPNNPFTSFLALSSPLASYSVPSAPASPSFDSRVADAFRAANNVDTQLGPLSLDLSDSPTKRRKIEEVDTSVNWPSCRLSHTQSHDSQSSSSSCDLVEKQLTQSLDLDVDVHGTTIPDGDGQQKRTINTVSGQSSISEESENIPALYPSSEGQAEVEMHATKQLASQSQSKSELNSQPQPRLQPMAQAQHEIPTTPLVQRKVQRQAWYQLPSYKPLRTRTHSQSTILSMSGTCTPTKQPRSPPHPNTPDARAHPESLSQSASANAIELFNHGQSQGQFSASGPLFHSGSLQVHPAKGSKTALTMDVSSQPASTGEEGRTEDEDDAMQICEDQSPTLGQARKRFNSRIGRFGLQSQFSQSHSSTDDSPTSMGSDSRPFSYGFLTQAPYQSQSLSQSQS